MPMPKELIIAITSTVVLFRYYYIKLRLQDQVFENIFDQNEKIQQQLQDKDAEILNLTTENLEFKTEILDLKTEILEIKSQLIDNACSTDLLLLVEHNQSLLQLFGIAFLSFGLILLGLIFWISSSKNSMNKRKGD
jgi:cell division protein FtsB